MPMDTLTASLSAVLNVTSTRDVGIDNPTDDLREAFKDSLALGFAADQADEIYHASRLVSAGDIDLAGSISDALGQVITFLEVTTFFLFNRSGNADVVVGNAANPFIGWFGAGTHTEAVSAGGWSFHHKPLNPAWAVVAGTGDIIGIAGTAGNTYDVVIIGRSA